jgi:hypothetical protein
MASVLQTVRDSSWLQRIVALALAFNVVLILWGLYVVPAALTPIGVAGALADILVQLVIGALVFFGPVSFQRYRSTIGIAVTFGALFAIAYDGILLTQFYPRLNPDFNVEILFAVTPLLAGFIAGYLSRSFWQGVIIAIWSLILGTAFWSMGLQLINYHFWGDTQHWYFFWLNDGEIGDFRASGVHDLQVYILQNMQGALFFHPLLSLIVGAIGGAVSSGLARGALALRRQRPGSAAA